MEGRQAFPTGMPPVLRTSAGQGSKVGGGFSQDRTQRGAPSCLRVPTPGLAREAAGGRAREPGFAVSCAQCTSEVFLGCNSPCRCTLVYLTIHFD